jgi:integrase
MRTRGIVITDRWKSRPPERRVGHRWRVRVRDPHHHLYESRTFADRTEGMRWASERRIKFQAHLDSAVAASFAYWGSQWLERLRLRDKSARYIRQTEVAIERLVAAGADDMRAPDFERIVERTIARLTTTRKGGVMAAMGSEAAAKRRKEVTAVGKGPASTATKNFHVTVARAVARHAMKKRAIPYDPLVCLEPFQGGTELRKIFSVTELRKLLSPAQEDDEWFVFMALLAYTGARSSEARDLRWDMVRWELDLIELPSQLAGNKLRIARQVPLQVELRDLLLARAQVGRGHIVGERLAGLPPGSMSRGFADYANRCGVEAGGRGPHCVRHTFCALMCAMDVHTFVVMSIVGHSEPVTAKHYASRALEVRQQVAHWPRGHFFFRRPLPRVLPAAAGQGIAPPVDLMASYLRQVQQPVAAPEALDGTSGG